jgi:general secretion pathway protein D
MLMKRPPLSTSIVSLLVATFAVAQPDQSFAQTQRTAESELQRRMQREILGRAESERGGAALRSKDYEAAFAHYKNACDNIADAPAAASSRSVAVGGLTESALRLAEQRITEGYYVSAVDALKEALRHNPDSRPVHKLLANIEAPDIFNKKMTPGFRAKVEEVKQGHLDAQQFEELGRYDLADKEAQKILNVDKYNKGAEMRRQSVADAKSQFGDVAYNSARAQAMWEVTKEWQRPYRRFDKRTVEVTEKSKSSAPSTVKIGKKLNSIIIPKIDFRDSTVREAIEFLVKKSKDLDEEREGVNIVLKIEGGAGPVLPAAAPVADAAGVIPGLDAAPAAPAAPSIPVASGSGDTRITLTLNNVPLIEALKYITLANLKYKIDPFAVTVVPIGQDTTEMFTKEWKVRPDFLTRIPGGGGGGGLNPVTPDAAAGAGGVAPLGSAMTAKDTLIGAGVLFPPGSIAIYSKSSSTLTVKNSSENLDLIEKIVESLENSAGVTQVEIQAKFVEITQNNLKELSFDWMLGQSNVPGISTNSLFTSGGTRGTLPQTNPSDFVFNQGGAPIGNNPITGGNRSGQIAISANAIDALLFGGAGASSIAPGIFSLVGARTDPQFQVVMRGLDQKKGVDLLSAPRVTTKPGQQAVIEIIREFRYPTEFEAPQIPQNFGGNNNNGGGGGLAGLLGGGGGGGSFPVTPTTPTTFEVKNTGVTLQVEPQIGPDGYSIDMNLAPQVVEFEGFINYGSPIQTTSTNALGVQTVNVITPNVINQPIFATRKVTTNVTVFDGATVVLGGLVREDVQSVEDKTPIIGDVPLLGRLFRSKVDQHIKRNLIIFVTAKLVNPAGDLVTSDDEIEEKVDALPLPDAPMALPELSGYRK